MLYLDVPFASPLLLFIQRPSRVPSASLTAAYPGAMLEIRGCGGSRIKETAAMAGATVWKGSIHFGDTDVAVKLHTAVSDERVSFHLLHAKDNVRLRQQMMCDLEKRPVFAEEQSKGFEVEEGKYILIDPADLEETATEASRLIEVHEFVKTSQLDPLFLDRVYYLEPDQKAQGYAALARSLKELEVAAICTWTMRKRSYLGALQAAGSALRLSTMRYADEVVAVESLALEDVPVTEKELAIGTELIEKLSVPFEPAKFTDEHQKRLLELIDRKARGEKITVRPPKRLAPTESDKLLQALEASLKKAA
jgi:DNA end-binding protein Ku